MRVSALRDVSKLLVSVLQGCQSRNEHFHIMLLLLLLLRRNGGLLRTPQMLDLHIHRVDAILPQLNLPPKLLSFNFQFAPSLAAVLTALTNSVGALGSETAEWGVEKMNLESRRSKRRLRATMSYLCWALLASMTSLARALRSLAN